MEQSRDDRGVAFRFARPTPRSIATVSTITAVYLSHGRRRRDLDARFAVGIPNGSFVNVVREDPQRRGLLYAGTENGVYVSFDDGALWQPLQLNLPVTSIRDIAVHGNDLVIATHGRAFWVIDDVAPLRQMPSGAPRTATISSRRRRRTALRPGNQESTPLPLDEPQVENAPIGLYSITISRRAAHAGRPRIILERRQRRAHVVERASAQAGRSEIASLLTRIGSPRIRCPSPKPARIASSGTSTEGRPTARSFRRERTPFDSASTGKRSRARARAARSAHRRE